jgi:hypothetical protein
MKKGKQDNGVTEGIYQMATEDISPGEKRVEREGDSSAVMNTLSFPFTSLYTIMVLSL